MTSITEDPSLPLDMDGTSNVFTNSHFGNHDNDMTGHDISSSISSELEHPGTFRNLTSAGKVSPHRTRTMKDQEAQLGEYKKENFGLKLRIYHLEEVLRRKWGDSDDGWKMNIELQVQLGKLKKDSEDKDTLLMKAKQAIDQMAKQHEAHIQEMQQQQASNQTTELEGLRQALAERDADLEQALREAQDIAQQMNEMQGLNDALNEALKDKEGELGAMQGELEDLQTDLEERTASHAPNTPTIGKACQTVEPLPAMLDQATQALEAAQTQLDEQQEENNDLKTKMDDKDQQIRQLEMDLLSSSQKLAQGADDYAREMQDQAAELDRCRGRLRDLDNKLREKEAELRDLHGEREGLGQQAREAETLIGRLQPLVAQRDKEIQDLQARLEDANKRGRERDDELAELSRKLRDAEGRARDAQPDLDARQREIERLKEELEERDDEMKRLRSKLREVEDALSHARRSAHRTGVDNREQNEALKKLADEIDALKGQLAKQQDGARTDLEAALAGKDATIAELQRELEELQSKLDQAEQTILHLTTSKAAELGVLKATIEDLNRQLEHLERVNRELRNEVGQLTGEKAGLEKEVDKLREENRALRNQLADQENELAEKKRKLAQAEQTIADLQKLIDDLQRRGSEQTGASEAELANLRSQLTLLERALRNKEAEVAALQSSVGLKERLIAELQEQLARLVREKEELGEKVRTVEEERNRLETELSKLRSQGRVSKLASDDLQGKLTLAFGEREELARKLQLAEEALASKETAHAQLEALIDQLREQIAELKRQLKELSHRSPPHTVTVTTHETTTTHNSTDGQEKPAADKGASSTTMIFGSPSDSLLLTILQKLQELSAEISAGRADSNIASSSLSTKMERLTELQRQLEDSFKSRPSDPMTPGSTHYTSYYIVDGGGDSVDGDHPHTSTPQSGATKRSSGQMTSDLSPTINYQQLAQEVDRLVRQLDTEREHWSQQQREFEDLQDKLKDAEDKVAELEHQLQLAMMRDAGTSTDAPTVETLQAEIDRLVSELDQARATIAALRGQLDSEKKESDQLRSELTNLQVTHTSPQTTDYNVQASSSLPNLKNLSDSWTSPAKASESLSEQPDVRELKRKHLEVTRLNQELQRKCREQLKRSPPSSCPGSGGQSAAHWQSRLREQEDRLRSEMVERECSLLAQIRESEARWIEREGEWRQLEDELRRQLDELQSRLSDAVRSEEKIKKEKLELEAECEHKDEEILNLSKALSTSCDKVSALESQLDQLLREKNETITQLEQRLAESEGQLAGSEEKLRWRVASLEGGEGSETEVTTLHETVDSLTQQLTSRIVEIEEMERKNRSLEEQKAVLNSQLASAQEQLLMLKEELALYQKLLDERRSNNGLASSADLDKVLQLLEEIRRLREQLDQSIHSNQALSEQLQSRLETSRSETTLQYTSQATTPRQSKQTTPTKATPPKRQTSHRTSPHVRLTTRSTSTHVPLSTRAAGTKGQSPPGRTTITLHYDSEGSAPHSFSDTKLSGLSTSSLSQPHLSTHSSPPLHHRSTTHVSTSSTSFTPPKDSSTPHTRANNVRHTATNTEGNPPPTNQHQQDHTSTTSHYAHTKITTTSQKGAEQLGGSPQSQGKVPTGGRHGSFTWSGSGDFDSLETRLQQALNSSSLPAADRAFLEDLLHYLRQQRKQLDDSRQLLERLEVASIPPTTHIHVDTAESGTLPTSQASPLHTHTASQTTTHTQTAPHSTNKSAQATPTPGTHTTSMYSFRSKTTNVPKTSSSPSMRHGTSGMGNRVSGIQNDSLSSTDVGTRTGKVDLSKLYEQLLQTQSSLAEARTSLSQKMRQ